MMAGFLLARAGIEVVVLEKHWDFLRDFRGDTVHPSTLEVMHELGLLEDFLQRPHQKIERLRGVIGDTTVTIADFAHLPATCRYIVLMPQWDFLDFLADNARQYPHFKLLMDAEATDLLTGDDKVTGVKATTADGLVEVHAELTIGADGRGSRVRDRAGLRVEDFGAPIDVFWLRISRKPDEEAAALGRIRAGHVFVMLDRGSYWQCAYVIPKGASESVKSRGLEAFRQSIARIAPELADRVHELHDWDQVKLLTVKVDRLEQWHRVGLLVIGDAAHAMSPIGGVGINLAIQDAVAAANILADALYEHRVGLEDLAAVQKRRALPTRMTQSLQLALQERVIKRVLHANQPLQLPFTLKLLNRFPILQRIPARLVGLGFRPEHVRSPAREPSKQ